MNKLTKFSNNKPKCKKVGELMDIFQVFKGKKDTHEPKQQSKPIPLFKQIEKNTEKIKQDFGNANDLIIREFELKGVKRLKGIVIGIDGLIDSKQAEEFIVRVLMIDLSLVDNWEAENYPLKSFDTIYQSRISMMSASRGEDYQSLYDDLLTGKIIVMLDGVAQFMSFACNGWQMRSIPEPETEMGIRGPQDAFIETIRVNTALIRRRIKDPRLRFDTYKVGKISQTDVFVTYLDGVVNPEFVQVAKERIEALDISCITDSSQLMQLIEDHSWTIFPRLIETERPDKVVATIVQGGVVILVDNTPFQILAPSYFVMNFQTTDDYYNRPIIATITRLLRYLAFLIVILVPGLYVAVSTYHQEMIPTVLLITIINQRSANPFPTVVETLIIMLLFEILREASVRKPKAIGDSMTIVGSLIIGQTIVQAGLVSSMVIIIGSLTAIASFILSNTRLNNAVRILSFIFIILGNAWGLYGITLGFIAVIMHLCSLTTFNQPYMAPIAPFNLHDQEDQFIRLPLYSMKYRPTVFKSKDRVRQNLKNSTREEEL